MLKSLCSRIVAFEVHGDCTVVPRAQPEKRPFCEQMDPTKSCPESSTSAYVKGKPSELKAPAGEGGARVRFGCEEVSGEGVAQKVGECFVENLKSRRTSAENAGIAGRTQPCLQAQRPGLKPFNFGCFTPRREAHPSYAQRTAWAGAERGRGKAPRPGRRGVCPYVRP
jgi:hypothetical protein